MKQISERISYRKEGKELILIISGKIERWKESLLSAWLFMWIFIGAYIIFQFFQPQEENVLFFLTAFLAFWVYFLFRIGKTFLWRKFGRELIRVADGKLTIKRDIKNYGKANVYFIDNIKNFDLVDQGGNAVRVFNESFWVIGGETLSFDYQHKHGKLGLQLPEADARKVGRLIKEALRDNRLKN